MVKPAIITAPRLVLIMGVAGSGKTTVGQLVACALGCAFFEADDFHSLANKTKMAHGLALDDADRAPWLVALRAEMDECRAVGQRAVFTCSALKDKYRAVLMRDTKDVVLVFLAVDIAVTIARVDLRVGHFMKAEMVNGQFAELEPPADALTIDATLSLDQIVAQVVAHVAGAGRS